MGRRKILALAGLLIVAGCAPAGQSQPRAQQGSESAARDAGASDEAGGLPVREYGCGTIALGFKVVAPGRYTDLDATTSGTFEVHGTTISFHGGHLDGLTGTNLTPQHGFKLADHFCGPWE